LEKPPLDAALHGRNSEKKGGDLKKRNEAPAQKGFVNTS